MSREDQQDIVQRRTHSRDEINVLRKKKVSK